MLDAYSYALRMLKVMLRCLVVVAYQAPGFWMVNVNMLLYGHVHLLYIM